MKGIIRLGDATTHGGVVVQASSDMVIEGKPAALVGDLVSCPIPGMAPIRLSKAVNICRLKGAMSLWTVVKLHAAAL